MDHEQFDDLTRAFASGISRRQMLKLLGGGMLTLAGFGPTGSSSAAARDLYTYDRQGVRSPANQPSTCPENRSTCGDYCCLPGQECYDGVCSDILSDTYNCGGPGNKCPDGQYCVDGTCSLCLKGHHVMCNGACCPENGTCETRGHARAVSCGHGQCCSVGENCCESLDERGRFSGTCCSASQTCATTHGPGASYTGACQYLVPLTGA